MGGGDERGAGLLAQDGAPIAALQKIGRVRHAPFGLAAPLCARAPPSQSSQPGVERIEVEVERGARIDSVHAAVALLAEGEQVLRHATHLHFLRAFGDPVAAMVAIDMLEGEGAAVTHAAMHLHGAVGGLAAESVRAEIADRHHVADLQRILPIHLPGGAEDESPQHLVLRPELDERELHSLLLRQRFAEGDRDPCAYFTASWMQ